VGIYPSFQARKEVILMWRVPDLYLLNLITIVNPIIEKEYFLDHPVGIITIHIG
jgi:hypothetical protein